MTASALGFRTGEELKDELEAERGGEPFLLYRDADAHQHIVTLDAGHAPVTVGRRGGSDVALSWDGHVSRLHAQLEHIGQDWVLVDNGLSRNGSFVNGDSVRGRRVLHEGDVVRVGE